MTRKEHLDWCKKRAMEYLDAGELTTAFISMISDMGKHEETRNHPFIKTATRLYIDRQASSNQQMRDLINGFD